MTTCHQSTTYLKPDTLKHHIIIATPLVDNDEHFAHAVIYICEHNIDGTMGLIINKPFKNLKLSNVLEQMDITKNNETNDKFIMRGGPIKKERGFILHKKHGEWESCLQIQDDIYLTTSRDMITAIAENNGPSSYIFALGFAGWDPAQLETEIATNNWLVIPAEESILFDHSPESIRKQAAETLNININLLGRSHGTT